MPDRSLAVKGYAATPEEHRALLSCRLEALERGTAMVNGGSPLPVQERWGWRAIIKQHGRSLDGSLCASVRVLDPTGKNVFTRNVRLVPHQRLNYR